MLNPDDSHPLNETNKYNHNFIHTNDGPQYCYEDICKFEGSSSEDIVVEVSLAMGDGGGNVTQEYCAGECVQCIECEDWFHPVCTFTTIGKLKQ